MIQMDDDELNEEDSLGLELRFKHKFMTTWTSNDCCKRVIKSQIILSLILSARIDEFLSMDI